MSQISDAQAGNVKSSAVVTVGIVPAMCTPEPASPRHRLGTMRQPGRTIGLGRLATEPER